MNVLILNGSLRPKGNTNKLCSIFKSKITERGHTFTEVNEVVSDCINCGYCIDNGICCIKDQMRVDFNSFDSVIIFSPIYFFNVSGKTRLMIDRMYANMNTDIILSSITVSGSYDFEDSGVDQFWNTLESTCRYCGYNFIQPINYVSYDKIIDFSEVDLSIMNEFIENMEELYREIKEENN